MLLNHAFNSYKRASEILRPQHALVYASIQGRTMKHPVVLMDLDSPKLTMRDIITAMSRPTKGEHLHFIETHQQSHMMDHIKDEYQHGKFDLRKRVEELRAQPPSERPTPTRIGR